jgi:hypothetical protein
MYLYFQKTSAIIVESFANVDLQVHTRTEIEIQTVRDLQIGETLAAILKIDNTWEFQQEKVKRYRF